STGSGIGIGGSSSDGNVIQGNFVGTDATGTAALGNLSNGISLSDVPNTIIGGTTAADRNVISGNGAPNTWLAGIAVNGSGTTGTVIQGNYIGTDVTGLNVVAGYSIMGISVNAHAPGTLIGGTAP